MTEETIPNPQVESNPEAEPQVFAVSFESGKATFSRKEFLELAAAASMAATALGCAISGSTPVKKEPSPMPRLFDTMVPTLIEGSTPEEPSATPEPTDTLRPGATNTPRPTNTPKASETLTVTATQAISAKVKKGNINLRSGPGTYYDRIGTTKQDESIFVLSRTEDSVWLRILSSTNLDCWISAEFVSLPVKVDAVPVEANIPPVPTGVPGTVPPGFTGMNYTLDGKTYTNKCGAPLPAGAVCTCNCVTVPGACGCDGDTGGGGGSCPTKGPGGHYWYPA